MGVVKLLTWNIGFAGGRYGLEGQVGSRSEVMQRLSGMADVLSDVGADVVCLQEVDRCSKRSFYIDQIDYLSKRAGYPYAAFVQTWLSFWVPYPVTWRLDRQFGPMDAGQVVLSRYPITWHAHVTHEKPHSRSGLFKYFYLDRVSQMVSIRMLGQFDFCIGHVHFEAFDVQARVQQAGVFSAMTKAWANQVSPMAICGDFNAMPQSPHPVYHFPDEPKLSYAKDATLALFSGDGFVSAGVGHAYDDYPSHAPNRQLTHVFYAKEISDVSYSLLQTGGLSDHLPVLIQYTHPKMKP